MQTIKEENKFVLCASTKLGSIGKTVGSQKHELVQCLLDWGKELELLAIEGRQNYWAIVTPYQKSW